MGRYILLFCIIFISGCSNPTKSDWENWRNDNEKIWEAERIQKHREALEYLKFSELSPPTIQEAVDRIVLKVKEIENRSK
jgi:hypothetical protein